MVEKWSTQEMIAYCDLKNKEAGKKLLEWLQITPQDDPNHYIGIDPETNKITGPNIYVGQRYRIIYNSPVRLPFKIEGEGNVVFHVAEIEGVLLNPFWLSEIKGVVCQPDNYSVRMSISADRSVFRLFVGDELKSI